MPALFEFRDYRKYLQAVIQDPGARRGIQSRLAEALGCQPSHISKVLGGEANLSLEQADLANEFLGHAGDARDYFLFLVEHDRAGTGRLKEYFKGHLDRLREAHVNLKKRFQVKEELSAEDKVVFYSHWYYAAAHAALSLPGVHNAEGVAALLGLSRRVAEEAIEFLVRTGMAVRKGAKVLQTMNRTHLGADSPLVARHHMNWRVKAIQSIEEGGRTDMHYSSVVTLSKEDLFRIKADFVRAMEEANRVIRDSPEETICGICLDLFEL